MAFSLHCVYLGTDLIKSHASIEDQKSLKLVNFAKMSKYGKYMGILQSCKSHLYWREKKLHSLKFYYVNIGSN